MYILEFLWQPDFLVAALSRWRLFFENYEIVLLFLSLLLQTAAKHEGAFSSCLRKKKIYAKKKKKRKKN